MMQLPTDEPIWVSKPAVLESMLRDLSAVNRLAVDTESNSLYVYREQVCLIQISTETTDYLVDPFALPDLSGLGPIFANPAVEKVFHAAEYDLICLKRDFDFKFANLFDTMAAARILGRPAVGLGSILEAEFGLHLDKRYQRADWGVRPLPKQQLDYARMDSHFLIALRNALYPALQASGRWGLAQEDFERLCAVHAPAQPDEFDRCWRVAGGQELTPTQAAVLQALCEFRDQHARAANLPPFKILGNQNLVQIALAATTPGVHDPVAAGQLSSRQANRYTAGLQAAVQRGLQTGPIFRPSMRRPDDRYLNRLDILRTWRKEAGLAMGVESDVVLPRDVMENIAQVYPHTLQDLQPLMAHLPWRFEHFGEQIIRAIQRWGG